MGSKRNTHLFANKKLATLKGGFKPIMRPAEILVKANKGPYMFKLATLIPITTRHAKMASVSRLI